ncbi:MAG: hypothetical protein IJ337_09355, partial [Clostridia bacterium]|nr:hypothetical protein [Clostridia bacterium]
DELIKLQQQGKQIEVACALCYVESARLKSPAQIQRFLDNRANVIREYFARRNEGVKAQMKTAEADYRAQNNIGDAPLKELPASIRNKVRTAKNAPIANYQVSAEEQKTIDKAMGMSVSDFTSADSLWTLKRSDPVLFDIYTSYIRNATKSKGIEGDTPWKAGDSKAISDELIRKRNEENGLRSQSWSDFQTYHILDYIAAVIELSTRDAKMQAYTKVPAYVKLMGETGIMINLSLIPEAKFDGTLKYDGVEGIVPEEAFELRKRFPDTAGTICIGIDDVQIDMLLKNDDIDYVIPYHRSGMDAATRRKMRIPTWKDYESQQGEKALSKDAGKAPKFSEWFDYKTAVREAREANNTPEGKAAIANGDVMYGAKIAMQNAAQRYIDLCAERNLAPKFQKFMDNPGYWKLLIDRKMINNVTGEIIEQKAVQPVFNEDTLIEICRDEVSRFNQNNADFNDAVDAVIEAYNDGTLGKAAKSAKIQQQVKAHEDWMTVQAVIGTQEQAQDEVKYSPRDFEQAEKTAKDGFDAWCKKVETLTDTEYRELKESTPLIMVRKDTPEIFRKYGAKDLKMLIRLDALYLAIREDGVQEGNYHRLGAENMESLVAQLDDPDAILRTDDGRLKALIRVNTKRGQAMASVELETKKDYEGKYKAVNLIVTAFDYERRYLKGQFTKYGAKVLHKKETLSQVNPQLHEWLEIFNESASGGIVTQNEPVVKKLQQRDLSELSDRELLVQALEGELSPEERDHLQRYKDRVDDIAKKQMQLEAINSEIVELRRNGATAKNSDELRKKMTNAKTLRASIDRVDAKLAQIESARMIQEVVKRNRAEASKKAYALARERADERQRKAVEHAREVGQRKVDRMKESQGKEKYKAQIMKDVKKLHTWLTTPSMKGSVPQFLRKPVADFLESIDFTSDRALKGGEATKNDQKFADALDALRRAVGEINKQQGDIEAGAADFAGYIDLPADYMAEFDDLVGKIKTT